MKYKVLVVMGSDSDFSVMETCIRNLVEFGIPYEARICSAHRTPELAVQLARNAVDEGFGVIIAAAGLAAHLPGVMAACTTLPVIGVPIKSGALTGIDALYSIVQMPSGIPVATVAIDGAANAAILAAQILALGDPQLADRLKQFKSRISESVTERQNRLEEKLREIK
jgi:5-(carboxyamino)imidazole ribonucleotide mutase